jgi:site-specific DNA-cytosine methylase
VLVACEFSGIVRDAFIAAGHDAWSCDLLPTETPGPHIVSDAIDVIGDGAWDLMVAHPPCTHLAVSGSRWFKEKTAEQALALEFVRELMEADIPRIAIENPISIISSQIRKPEQILQPWHFGIPETKAICLWLKGLPPLMTGPFHESTREARIHKMPPGPDRGKIRSIFYPEIARAMADQWGGLIDGSRR